MNRIPNRAARLALRLGAALLARLFFRVRVNGANNVPASGPALLVSNHVTWLDPPLLCAAVSRPIRFIIGREIFENRLLQPVFRLIGAIPISPADSPRRLAASIRSARKALDEGSLVCIFAEGAMTRNGNMRPFRNGFEHIMKRTNHLIVPVHIGGAWGSAFSYFNGRPLSSPHGIRGRPVSIVFGKPIHSGATAFEVRQAVADLSTLSFRMLHPRGASLPRMFLASARRHWFSPAISDTTGKRLTYGRTLAAALALAGSLRADLKDRLMAGVLLPACAGAALANLAITLLGRIPVNLNFTVSEDALSSAIRRTGIGTIISSRAFVEKMQGQSAMKIPEGCRIIFIEETAARIGRRKRLAAFLKAVFLPGAFLGPGMRRRGTDLATVVFSSGATGEPKGVMLSHDNIASDIESFRTLYRFTSRDRMCAFLPLFHSFGLTCTLWCPLLIGFSAHYHSNPLDVSRIAAMTREERLTIMLATPTFLLSHIRKTAGEDFASLRIVITGAEKLSERVSELFAEKFGIPPMEGYGATELAPVAALNVPDVISGRVSQQGRKPGSIGHPIPGVAMKIVNIETAMPAPHGEQGLLLVKGPNVMTGYLDMPEKTREVLRDGWYNTGDMGAMDEDGFVFIRDRLSRHSKIAGEMIPHCAIEEKFHELLGVVQRVLAIGSAHDEQKGEQLVVFHLKEAGDADFLHEAMARCDLPNLWKPKRDNYATVESLPMLGSGKPDLARLRQMAREFLRSKQ